MSLGAQSLDGESVIDVAGYAACDDHALNLTLRPVSWEGDGKYPTPGLLVASLPTMPFGDGKDDR